MRLACLYVPDFPLAALLRCYPELRESAVAVSEGSGPRAKLLAVSPAAARRGVRGALSVAQAMAIDADLVVRTVSSDMRRAAQAALCDVAASFSPRIEDSGDGIAYVDLEGLGSLFESESQLATAMAQRTVQLGIDAQVGVAGSKVAAWLAARQSGGVAVIPKGEEWSFLVPVPVSLLAPSPNLAATLQRWGIHTIGELAALPIHAVGTRLGPEGVLLVRRARGEDDVPLLPRPLPMNFEESVDLDYGVDNLEPFLFVLRGLLDRLTARLGLRGFLCGDLRLSLRLAGRGRDERTVTVTAPSNDVKALLMLVRLQLEAHPAIAAIEALRVVALPEKLRAAQLDLFRPNGPAPAQLAVTLARLTAICGADRVGEPIVADSHRPEAYGVKSFEAVTRLSGYAIRETTLTANRFIASRLCPCLRAIRPPQSIDVFCQRDHPDFIRGPGFAGRVVHAAGPWRLQGDWWNEGAYARDYYDVQLSDGGVYRVYREAIDRRWFVEGTYD
ncbi:MAG: DNA polymerase Y family protein [Deltaproteobacteria bacterium]|nr:DNA polymerase Y family protein [Deltaproteobacteria bacterium]